MAWWSWLIGGFRVELGWKLKLLERVERLGKIEAFNHSRCFVDSYYHTVIDIFMTWYFVVHNNDHDSDPYFDY
jgi:hypothetical protein